MTATWDEASACPADETPGKVMRRQPQQGGGQLVTLTCNQTRCPYHTDGWVVQVRPDNTIPDKIDPRTREKQFTPLQFNSMRREATLAALAEQARSEQRPGYEVPRV